MNDVFAAPAKGLPFLPTAWLSQLPEPAEAEADGDVEAEEEDEEGLEAPADDVDDADGAAGEAVPEVDEDAPAAGLEAPVSGAFGLVDCA
jgi:hypothetical protein